jgi:glutamyl endopeptidase
MSLSDEVPLLFLDRLADRADYAVIGPTDGRTRVLHTNRPPYSAVCQIERDFGDGRLSGCSGFLVTPTVVLTAAHCVFSRPRHLLLNRGAPARIRVTPGRNGASAAFGSQWAARWYAHRRFVAQGDVMFDVGIIVLPRPFSANPGALPLVAMTEASLQEVRAHRLLHIAGYPGDKPRGTMWGHAERLDRVGPRALYYSVDTCPGHSGSPVWVQSTRAPGGVKAIGIHVAGPAPHAGGAWGCRPGVPVAPAGAVNRGIRITRDLLALQQAASRGRAHAALVALHGTR